MMWDDRDDVGTTGTTGTTWGRDHGDNGGDHGDHRHGDPTWGPSGGYGDDVGMMGMTQG